ncbi:MAG: hypothetical protein IT473_02150 [Lysobacter sp.]|nr:hypothetical protein [Lysobacter sp.]
MTAPPSTLLALDVCYERDGGAIAAGIAFETWTAAAPIAEFDARIETPHAYEPGAFYKRELPCLLRALEAFRSLPIADGRVIEAIVVDGYVDLDASGRPGLGRRLYEALDGRIAVVGVAKTPFTGIEMAHAVLRGASARPLFVTVAGLELDAAKRAVISMHGPHRIPTLLNRVDRLSRTGLERIGKMAIP